MKLKGNYMSVYNFANRVVYDHSIIYHVKGRKLQIAGLEIKFKRKIVELFIFNTIYVKDKEAAEFGGFEEYNRLIVDSYIIYYK